MIRSRIAPTPSGYLHIGNVVNFVITWLWVRKNNGSLRLRIDDLDSPRTKPEYIEDIFYTLEWLGLDWDEGPKTPDEQMQKYSQQLRIKRYDEYIEQLIKSGQVFACSCSRKDIAAMHVCNCRIKNFPLNKPDSALRIYTPPDAVIIINDHQKGEIRVNLYDEMRDFIIRRRDGIPAYQVASLADDIDFNMNLIIRGEDLINSTATQLYLSGLCRQKGFPEATFYHHALLKDEHGEKLSKSAGSASLKSWRESNIKPEKFYKLLSEFLGWKDLATSADEMLKQVKSGASLIMK